MESTSDFVFLMSSPGAEFTTNCKAPCYEFNNPPTKRLARKTRRFIGPDQPFCVLSLSEVRVDNVTRVLARITADLPGQNEVWVWAGHINNINPS